MEVPPLDVLRTRIESLNDLEQNERYLSLVSIGRIAAPHGSDALLASIEVVYDDGLLLLPDFCAIIRIGASFTYAIRILRTRTELSLLLAAINVIRIVWYKEPELLSDENHSLSEILPVLPSLVTRKLLRILGERHWRDVKTPMRESIIDAIIYSAIPSLDITEKTKSSRHNISLLVVQRILHVASESVILRFVTRYSDLISPKQWAGLAKRRSKLISNLILDRCRSYRTGNQNNRSIHYALKTLIIHGSPRNHQKNIQFVHECLFACIASPEFSEQTEIPVFGSRILIFSTFGNDGFMKALLSGHLLKSDGTQSVLELFIALKTIYGSRQRWRWSDIAPFVGFVAEAFAREKDRWSLIRPSEWAVDDCPTTTLIRLLFENLAQPDLPLASASSNHNLLAILETLPTDARLAFLTRAYYACFGIDLLEKSDVEVPIHVAYIFVLGWKHGHLLLQSRISTPRLITISHNTISRFKLGASFVASYLTLSNNGFGREDGHSLMGRKSIFEAGWLDWDLSASRSPASVESTERDGILETISLFKTEASRASQPWDRQRYLEVAILLIEHTHDIELLNSTIEWISQRFVRDPYVGKSTLNMLLGSSILRRLLGTPWKPLASTDMKVYLSTVQEYFLQTHKIYGSLVRYVKALLDQPGNDHDMAIWNNYGTLLGDVIKARLQFTAYLQQFSVAPEKLRAVFLDDVSELLLAYVSSEANSGRNALVQMLGSLEVRSKAILPILIPWLDDMGDKIHNIYCQASDSGRYPKDNMRQRATFWPFNISFHHLTARDQYLGFDTQSTRYISLLERILFLPKSTLTAYPEGFQDPYFRYCGTFSDNVSKYLDYSLSSEEAESKLRRLLDHYGPIHDSGSTDNLALLLVTIPRVKTLLQTLPDLIQSLADKILPSYPPSDKSIPVTFSLMTRIEPFADIQAGSILGKMTNEAQRSSSHTYTHLVDYLMIPKAYSKKSGTLLAHTAHRMGILAVAWLCTKLKLPVKTDLLVEGPITYALGYVRVEHPVSLGSLSTTLKHEMDRLTNFLLVSALPWIRQSEINILVCTILSSPITSESRMVVLTLIRILRTRFPGAALDLAFHILGDMESSSWHRQALTKSLLATLTPKDAVGGIQRFFDLMENIKAAQQENVPTAAEDDQGTKKPGVYLKISAVKLSLEILQLAVECGISESDALAFSRNATNLSSHCSVTEAYMAFVIGLLRLQNLWGPPSISSGSNSIWSSLIDLVDISTRLSETEAITDDHWTDALSGKIPLPIVRGDHPIGTGLFRVAIKSLPRHIRVAWLERVLFPSLVGHISNRNRWLKAFATLVGWPQDKFDSLEASYTSPFDPSIFLGSCTENAHDVPEHILVYLLSVLERRILACATRESFRGLAKHVEGENWHENWLVSLRTVIPHMFNNDEWNKQQCVKAITVMIYHAETPLQIIHLLLQTLERIGDTLLAPSSIFVSYSPDESKKATPFQSFLEFVPLLAPPGGFGSLSQIIKNRWNLHMKPLFSRLLQEALRLEKGSLTMHQGGSTAYWPVIIVLRTLLLRHPSLENSSDPLDRSKVYATDLFELSKHITSYPAYRLLLPFTMKQVTTTLTLESSFVLPVIRSLTLQAILQESDVESLTVCFDIAFALLRHEGTEADSEPMKNILREWEECDNPMLLWFVMTYQQTLRNRGEFGLFD